MTITAKQFAKAEALIKDAAGEAITLARAAKVFGTTENYTRTIIKQFLLAGMEIPEISDFKPRMEKSETARRRRAAGKMQAPPQTEALTAPFGQPTDPRQSCETGEGFEVDPKPILAWIWPMQNGKMEKKIFYRLC